MKMFRIKSFHQPGSRLPTTHSGEHEEPENMKRAGSVHQCTREEKSSTVMRTVITERLVLGLSLTAVSVLSLDLAVIVVKRLQIFVAVHGRSC